MKTYGELNLETIREKNNLDFAHFTYQRNMCSCCFGPKDLPKRYWKDHVIPAGDDYTYILFKNASNGSGSVTKNDPIRDYTCVSHHVKDMEQLTRIGLDLQRQLGPGYFVEVPTTFSHTIVIRTVEGLEKDRIKAEQEAARQAKLDEAKAKAEAAGVPFDEDDY